MKPGTHSVKKWGATMAQRAGATRDDVNYRARWKTRGMQENYLGVQLDWPDINAASKLCYKGICLYKEKDASGITKDRLALLLLPRFEASLALQLVLSLQSPCFGLALMEQGGSGLQPCMALKEPSKPCEMSTKWNRREDVKREFTAAERGWVKFKSSNRKVIWRCIERLLNRGNDVNTAINKIKCAYGDLSITNLIKKTRADERYGGNPVL
eukprot:jgi/Psemu1/32101/gm1.32101_g